MLRRNLLLALGALFTGGFSAAVQAAPEDDGFIGLFGSDPTPRRKRRRRLGTASRKLRKTPRQTRAKGKKTARRNAYQGRTTVSFRTSERPGTIIVKTSERALYYVLGSGKAVRYGVAVGKEGFSWAGVAKIGRKVVNPPWTPPAEMIERKPELAEWAGGMPGGIPDNPLGVRAMYLYKGGRDTLFRIHGTNAPSSIGTAASSGCIRMLNSEVIELYGRVRIGTKVIVL